jgi:transposase
MVAMHIEIVPNRNSKPAILLRESYREGKKVRKRTLGNLSKLPMEQVEAIRRILKGEQLVSTDDLFEIVENGSRLHGNVEAVLTAMRRLGFERLLCSRPSRERDLIVAMVAARILEPQSKLATTRWWSSTTLLDMLGIDDADEYELYDAMDWLLERQDPIEKKLAARHLEEGGLALYDLTSSYFEGVTCPLAKLGHNRDGKKGKLQVNYGLLTSSLGIPVAVSVFEGNSGDPKTLLPQVDKMRESFGIGHFVLVGDRGMITQKQVDALREIEDVDWLSALRPGAIRKLVDCGAIQMGLFDERNLFELAHPDWPEERLIACRNPALAKQRKAKRDSLLEATAAELDKVRQMVERSRLHGENAIGDRVSKILGQYKVGKYYTFELRDDGFDYKVDEASLAVDVKKKAGSDAALAAKRLKRYRLHIESIAKKLDELREKITRGRLHGKDEIGVRVGRIVNKYKVAKHFKLHIEDASFHFEVDQEKVDAEAALDGIYVVRTSVKKQVMNAEQTVLGYKQLANVERAFRCLKSVDLMVRPIRHRRERRVRAHIFLCMLAYYVQWHMIDAWRPLLFADEDQEAKASRDPVAPAKRSKEALKKAADKQLEDGSPVHSFSTLLNHLGEIVRNTCRCPDTGSDKGDGDEAPTFYKTTTPNPKQRKALDLLRGITV